jgi:hypothetical protein
MSSESHHGRGWPQPGWTRTAVPAAGLALALSLVSGCSSGPGRPAGAAARPATRATTTAARALTAIRGLGGHGELAFAADGRLYLTGGPAGALRRVRLPGVPDGPAWSAGRRWLAVQVAKPPPAGSPYLTEPAALWLVSAAGTAVRRLTPPSWDVTSFAWSPRSDRLAVAAGLPAPKDTSFAVADG